jgi:hypothetical protein
MLFLNIGSILISLCNGSILFINLYILFFIFSSTTNNNNQKKIVVYINLVNYQHTHTSTHT